MKTISMTIDEIKAHFPDKIPEKFLQEVDRAKKPHYIWILKGDWAYCEMCGQKFPGHYMTHRSMEICPCCHGQLEARKAWVGQLSARRNVLSYHFARSVRDKKVLTCMAVFTCYGYEAGEAPWKTLPFRRVEALYIFKAGEGAAYATQIYKMHPASLRVDLGLYYYDWGHGPGYVSDWLMKVGRLSIRDSIYTPMTVKLAKIVILYEDHPIKLAAIAKGTPFYYLVKAYAGILAKKAANNKSQTLWAGVYGEDYWLRLLERGAKYPLAVEIIAKMGLGEVLYDTVRRNDSLNHVFNLRGQTINKIFKGPLTKADKIYMYDHGDKCSMELIELWQKCRQNGLPESLEWLSDNINRRDRDTYIELVGLMGKPAGRYNVKLPQVVNYIAKQGKQPENECARAYHTTVNAGFYRDYIRDCVGLSQMPEYAAVYDLRRKDVWFPQKLDTAHQQTIDIKNQGAASRRIVENAERLKGPEEKYKKLRQELTDRYSFAAKEYQIIIPPDLKDLYREGAEMHNCVASYINRAANDEARILYIRSNKEPEKSLGTMEISPKTETIVQARGKYNRDLPDEVSRFVKLFEKKILMPLRGERVKLAC